MDGINPDHLSERIAQYQSEALDDLDSPDEDAVYKFIDECLDNGEAMYQGKALDERHQGEALGQRYTEDAVDAEYQEIPNSAEDDAPEPVERVITG